VGYHDLSRIQQTITNHQQGDMYNRMVVSLDPLCIKI
jgi:hypothetical protein